MSSVIGKIVLTPRGTYDPNEIYERLDWVRYGGKAWVCKAATAWNVTPTEGDTWTVLAEDGTGGGGSGDWSGITNKPFETIGAGLSVNLLDELEVAAKNTYIPTGTSSDRPISGQGVKVAIDNVVITISKADYDNLSSAEKNDPEKVYYVYDETTDDSMYYIERPDVTVSSTSTAIRFPASGTDSHIHSTSDVVNVVSDSGSRWTSITVYEGYVELKVSTTFTNKRIGLYIANN